MCCGKYTEENTRSLEHIFSGGCRNMGEVIVVTSGKGGVGKTTTVANIGTGLAMLDKRTVVVDTDIGLRNLDVILGLENRIVYNLVETSGTVSASIGTDKG